jgi:hypothetical protein
MGSSQADLKKYECVYLGLVFINKDDEDAAIPLSSEARVTLAFSAIQSRHNIG